MKAWLLLLLVHVLYGEVYKVEDPGQTLLLHLEEPKFFLKDQLRDAVDVMLIHHGNMDGTKSHHICRVFQRGVDTQTQEIELIDPSLISSVNFDPMSPTNIRSFISMSHINDGIVAITSDLELYLLKFDYQALHQTSDSTLTEKDEDLQPKFASLHWKTNLKQVATTHGEKSELPQLVYDASSNQALLVFTDSAMIFSIGQMEKPGRQSKVVNYKENEGGWKKRLERGWTKSKDSYMYSAVGTNGIDVYKLGNYSITYQTTITQQSVDGYGRFGQKLIVEDFEVISCDEKISNGDVCHLLYILDPEQGILILRVYWAGLSEPMATMVLKDIGPAHGGVAMDTYDGKTVVAAYKGQNNYHVYEFHVDTKRHSWDIINYYSQRSKLVDVKINQDIAILQGVNHHQILFHGIPSDFKQYAQIQPIILNYGGVRDFDFFELGFMQNQREDITAFLGQTLQTGYYFDDFLFGITNHKLFVTKYRVTPAAINCYTEEDMFVDKKLLYTVNFNTTTCDKLPVAQKNSICQHSMNFVVEVVKTLIYQDDILMVILICVVVFLILVTMMVFLCAFYRRYQHDAFNLSTQIAQYGQKRVPTGNTSINQLQMDQSVEIPNQRKDNL